MNENIVQLLSTLYKNMNVSKDVIKIQTKLNFLKMDVHMFIMLWIAVYRISSNFDAHFEIVMVTTYRQTYWS